VSNLNKKIYAKIRAWRNRRIEGEHPYRYLDGIVMKRNWAGEARNVSLLVASAVNSEGFREILGICEGAKEDKSGWSAFFASIWSTAASRASSWSFPTPAGGLVESVSDFLPEARYQRCMVHFYHRNVFSLVPSTKVREVSHMLKAIHAQESREAADNKAKVIIGDLRASKMAKAADLVGQAVHETLLWLSGRSLAENPNQQPARADHEEIRRGTRVVDTSPASTCGWTLQRGPTRAEAGEGASINSASIESLLWRMPSRP
jgi:putative transposase